MDKSNKYPDIVGMVTESKRKKIIVFPCHSNRASQIGDECLRKLVYYRTSWDKQQLHDVGLQFIFDGGNTIEKQAEEELREAGIEVFEQQRYIKINEHGENITGRMDNRISSKHFSGSYACEIKGLAQWTCDKLNEPKDFFESDKHYIKKYPAQLLTYLYGSNEPTGCFYIKNKQTWKPKVIWFELDDHIDYVQGLLEKAIIVNEHVSLGTLPDYCNDPDNCESCPFNHICQPPLESFGCVIDDAELQGMLDQRELIKDQYSEYTKLSDGIKEAVKGREKIIVGDWLIKGKEDKRGAWRTTIKKLNV